MSAADQRKVVEALRLALPEGMDRWTPSLVARQAGLSILEANIAIRSLRNTGKIKFGALELSASMMADNQEYQAKAGDDAGVERASEAPVESVSRGAGARAPAATSELMDATAGETAPDHQSTTEPCAHPPGEQGEVAAAGDAGPLPSVPGHSRPNLIADDASLGRALLAEIELYLARTRMGASLLGDLALTHPGYVNLLRRRGTARDRTAGPIRAFMERWPNGATRDQVRAWNHDVARGIADAIQMASVAAAPGVRFVEAIEPAAGDSLADVVKAEAMGERRRPVRKLSATVHDPLSASVVGLQAALLAEPEDAFLFLRRQWPQLLRGVIARAHDDETTPATMLARVIEAGLMAIVAEQREQAA
jgi:hypothetical protein